MYRSEILQVVETRELVYFMCLVYDEGDASSGVGNVYAWSGAREPGIVPEHVLATNDELSTLWASPSGKVWVGSCRGNVATTADVTWPAPTNRAHYSTLGRSPNWSVTNLPRVRASGLPPNVSALWGTSDDDVFAGTYGGHIYHWDGKAWSQTHDGPDGGNETIRAFGGTGPRDVVAAAANSTLLHFDGAAWRRIVTPGAPNGHETFTGIAVLPDGEILISGAGNEGRLLRGSAAALTELARFPIRPIDMGVLGSRVLFATGDGVAELIGTEVSMIKSTFRTAAINKGIERLFFIEAAQEEGMRYIEFNPRVTDALWWRFTF